MRSVSELIGDARYFTKNTDFVYVPSTGRYTSGISTELFLRAINYAQDHLQSKMMRAGSDMFVTDEIKALVANVSEYRTTKRVFGGTGFVNVFYNSESSVSSDDYGPPLGKGNPRDRRFFTGSPTFYVPLSGKVALVPVPESSQGGIKISFNAELDDLDIVRGELNGAPGAGATIVLFNVAPHATIDIFQITNARYVCVSDRDGNVMLRNGVVSGYNSGTFTLTLAANVSTYLETGYTLANLANGYLTCGKNTTNASQLPDHCERYLSTYAQKRVLMGSDSDSAIVEDNELLKIEEEILSHYSDETSDVDAFPILDEEILT